MDNRSTILLKAQELFAGRGYDGVGVQEIAEASGITKPTLYHYFGSKRGLLKALLCEQHGRLGEELRAAADYHGDLPLTLRRVTRAFFRFAEANPVFYRMQLSMFFAPPESDAYQEVAELNQRHFAVLEDLFRKAAENHGNMRNRHSLYAASFLGTLNNCIALSLAGHYVLSESLLQRVVHQFEHGIYS